jgi:phage shock protein C
VATGLAEWRDLPADPVRLIVFLSILFTGFFPGALIYLGAALVIPMNPEANGSTEHRHYHHHYESDDTVSDSELKAQYEKLKRKVEKMESEILDKERDWDQRFRE